MPGKRYPLPDIPRPVPGYLNGNDPLENRGRFWNVNPHPALFPLDPKEECNPHHYAIASRAPGRLRKLLCRLRGVEPKPRTYHLCTGCLRKERTSLVVPSAVYAKGAVHPNYRPATKEETHEPPELVTPGIRIRFPAGLSKVPAALLQGLGILA